MAIKFEEKSAAKPGDKIKKSFEFAIYVQFLRFWIQKYDLLLICL